jgi:hypothetical protein
MDLRGVYAWEPYVQGHATLGRDGEPPAEVRVRGVPAAARLARIDVARGRRFSGDAAREAILNAAFQDPARAPRVGDVVTLVSRGERRTLRVVGLVTDASSSTVFVPIDTARALLRREGKVSGAYVSFDAGAPPDLVGGDDLVAGVQGRVAHAAATAEYLDALRAGVAPLVALDVTLAFAFVAGVVAVVVAERRADYAVLRALGHGAGAVAKALLVEVSLLGVAAGLASLAAWLVLARVLHAPMTRAWFWVALDFRLADWASVAVPAATATLVAALPGIRELWAMEIGGALRACPSRQG